MSKKYKILSVAILLMTVIVLIIPHMVVAAMPNEAEIKEMFSDVGVSSAFSGQKFASGTLAPDAFVFEYLFICGALEEYSSEGEFLTVYDVSYEDYMNIVAEHFALYSDMKTYLSNIGVYVAETDSIHVERGGAGDVWAWVVTNIASYGDTYVVDGVYLRGTSDEITPEMRPGYDYYNYNGYDMPIEQCVRMTLKYSNGGVKIYGYEDNAYYVNPDDGYLYSTDGGEELTLRYRTVSVATEGNCRVTITSGTTRFDNSNKRWLVDGAAELAFSVSASSDVVISVTDATGELNVSPLADGTFTVTSSSGHVTISVEAVEAPTETTVPDETTDIPETETDAPETETAPPETETDAPETETDPPETEIYPPETETDAPETETDEPETETTAPDEETTGGDVDTEVPPQLEGYDTFFKEEISGISVHVNPGTPSLFKDARLVVGGVSESERKRLNNMIEDALGKTDTVIYDLKLVKNGVLIEDPEATMLVTIPVPNGWNGEDIKIYYIDAAGNRIVDTNGTVSADGSAITFVTDHMRYFAVAKAADTSGFMKLGVILLTAAGALIVIVIAIVVIWYAMQKKSGNKEKSTNTKKTSPKSKHTKRPGKK